MRMSPFYDRQDWKRLRYEIVRKKGGSCQACGATKQSGAVIQVDQIKPISKYPELALTESNLQVLCRSCNLGKSAHHEDSFEENKDKSVQLIDIGPNEVALIFYIILSDRGLAEKYDMARLIKTIFGDDFLKKCMHQFLIKGIDRTKAHVLRDCIDLVENRKLRINDRPWAASFIETIITKPEEL